MKASGEPKLDTLAVHAGGPAVASGSVVTPIHQASTFAYPAGERPLRYTRYGNNPTQEAVQARVAALEGTERALVTASGMAALATAVLSVCGAGDHVVAARDLYGGTHALLDRELPRLGIDTTYAQATPEGFAAALEPRTRLILWEAISNPLLRVADGPELAGLARERGIVSLIDATFASPINQRPGEFGVDLVMQSATKYLGGHSDLIAGTLAGSAGRIDAAVERMKVFGGSADPHAAFLLERGIKTLAIRMERHNANGRAVAEFLAGHPAVKRVHHPTLSGDPAGPAVGRLLSGGGGVVTFVPRATPERTRELTRSFRWIRLAPSLGGVESLVSMPSLTSHRGLPAAEREARGIPDQTVRLALGIEAADDLIADLDRGLAGL